MVSEFVCIFVWGHLYLWKDVTLFSADDGEVFQVKKTSHSRRLMKQLKAEKKREREEATAAAALEASKDGGLDADRATTAAAYSDALANIPFPSR